MGTIIRNFKRIKVISLILIILGFFSSCSTPRESNLNDFMQEDGRLRVLTSTAMIEDMVKKIGGDSIKVISLIGPDQDPHSYEIVKGDGEKFEYADLIFVNGLSLEHSASMRYQTKRRSNVTYIGDEIKNKFPDRMIYVEDEVDPHIWMDISLWSEAISIVEKKLSDKDPKNQQKYSFNAEKLKREYLDFDTAIALKIRQIPDNKRYLVTSHDAFNYFVRRYFASQNEIKNGSWRPRMQALQGLAPDQQISLLEIKELVNHIYKYKIEVIFAEANLSKDSLEKVKEAVSKKGLNIRIAKETLYGDTLGGLGYLQMMSYDASVLENNLNAID
jgi:manganese/zinc/iron transport system substrate-binding protein